MPYDQTKCEKLRLRYEACQDKVFSRDNVLEPSFEPSPDSRLS